MLSKNDISIKENIEKDQTLETFFDKVLIEHAGLDEVEEHFYTLELYRVCHTWQGRKDKDGYGRFTTYSKNINYPVQVLAHRFAYAVEFGFDKLPIGNNFGKDRLVINHMCFNRACVNPYHLEVITHEENSSIEKRKPKNDK
jgi:hypothetical protein